MSSTSLPAAPKHPKWGAGSDGTIMQDWTANDIEMRTIHGWESGKIAVRFWLPASARHHHWRAQPLSGVHGEPLMWWWIARFFQTCQHFFFLLIIYIPKEEESSGCRIPDQRGSTHRRRSGSWSDCPWRFDWVVPAETHTSDPGCSSQPDPPPPQSRTL